MRLYQIPFSHNCVKVRKALELKGLTYETVDINPVRRGQVRRASGQVLVPALADGERAIAGSTAILLYLEETYPQRPLLPPDSKERAECRILAEWADETFMALTRRIAYWRIITGTNALGDLFFPRAPRPLRRLGGALAKLMLRGRLRLSKRRNRRDEVRAREAAEQAVARLGGRDHLVGDATSIADIALATMSAPLAVAAPAVRDHPAVQDLLQWGRRTLDIGREFPAAALFIGDAAE